MSAPYYEDELVMLYHGDCLEVMRSFERESFDAIITDPPYELGFMGKDWDKSGVAFQTDVWKECLRIAKPGTHLLAFGGSRTWHRLAAAIEDAGWGIEGTIAWIHAEGKPQSQNRLKPAFEPIILARNGIGVLNCKDCRVVADENPNGRWPTDVLLDGDSADQLDIEAGPRASGAKRPYVMAQSASETVSSFARGMGGKPRDFTSVSTVGLASRFFPVFRFESKAPQNERPKVGGVQHTTVKPLALMQWLIRLTTNPGAKILDPFSGSGTTGEAAILEGRAITMVEKQSEYMPLIMQRMGRATSPLFTMGDAS